MTFDERWSRQKEDEGPFTHWIAVLSDGQTVVDDEGRVPGNSWLRLLEYCERNGVAPVKVGLRFRDNHVWAPAGQGYVFRKSLTAVMGGPQENFYVIGVLQGEKVHLHKYHVPTLTLVSITEKAASNYQNGLIYAPGTHGELPV